ncbi:MAG: acetyl-CoA hydrolase/transferase C-terminal domain-containing protein, partial [Acidobacteriota bacterium]
IKMVHILLQGPVPYLEEGLQDRIMAYSIFSGGEVRLAANEGRAFYLPCTIANVAALIDKNREYEPDIVIIKVRKNENTEEYSLGLSVEALHTAIDHAQLVIAELDPTMPFTQGQSVVDSNCIDYIITDSVKPVYTFPPSESEKHSPQEQRIGELITEYYIRDGVTLQVGIGKIPDAVIGTIITSPYRNLGVQTELYSDGLMLLQKLGKVTNRKKKVDMGYSTTTLIMGSEELYEFVHMRAGVQMRPCAYTNSAEIIRANSPFISVNSAMGVDIFGNVWADWIAERLYYSGVGGQPDFIRALNDPAYGAPIIALKSTTRSGESKIVKAHPRGVSLTASSYDGVVIITEYGIADLRGLTVGEKALAVSSVAHPRYREEFLRSIFEDRLFTKPLGYFMGKTPRGVIPYRGSVKLDTE